MASWVAEIGQGFLMLALSLCLWTVVLAWSGAQKKEPRLVALARKGMALTCLAASGAVLCLAYALAKSHFEIAYVAKVTNRDLPLFYKLTALWAGQAGSLLLWTWLLSLYGVFAAALGKRHLPDLLPWAMTIAGITGAFFLALNLFAANPFQLLKEVFTDGTERPFIPRDGQGLNPLLQHPAMTIHPPILYLGYVGFTIPFAFAMAALIVRKADGDWTASLRRWTLVSWLFLGTGIVLGGYWAYLELGWGGYWAWDPVENASILPWFTATAFLHSIVVQQRRGMLKGWNFTLIAATFLLCIFGTFLTRSGIVSSVHAFGKSTIGPFFAGFLGISAVLSLALIAYRWRDFRADHRFESMLSRESSFLYNNFLFLLACLAILGGTLFPVFSEWFTGNQITLGQDFYNGVFIPIGLLILLLMGAAPLLDWRKTAFAEVKRVFPVPLSAALIGLSIGWATGARSLYTLLAFALAAFVTVATVLDVCRDAACRRKNRTESFPAAFAGLFRVNRRRYGGYVVHLGMVAMAMGLTGAAFNTHVQGGLREGQSLALGPYIFQCNRIRIDHHGNPNYATALAEIDVFQNGRAFTRLSPEKRFYFASEQSTSEVALHSTLREDLYAVLSGLEDDGIASIQIYRNPLVAWIWLGGFLMALGTGIALLPAPKSGKGFALALALMAAGFLSGNPSARAQASTRPTTSPARLFETGNSLQVHLSVLMLGALDAHTLVVQKRYRIVNEANAIFPAEEGIALYVPESTIGDVTATIDRGGVKSEIRPVPDPRSSIYRIPIPVEPGELSLDVRYRIPFHPGEHAMKEVFLYPTHAFPVFVFPPSVHIRSDRIEPVSRQERMNRYQTTQGFDAGEALLFILWDTALALEDPGRPGTIMERPNRLQKIQLPLIAGTTLCLFLAVLGGLARARPPKDSGEVDSVQLEKQVQVLQDTLRNLDSQRQAGLLDENAYRERQNEAQRKLMRIRSQSGWKE